MYHKKKIWSILVKGDVAHFSDGLKDGLKDGTQIIRNDGVIKLGNTGEDASNMAKDV